MKFRNFVMPWQAVIVVTIIAAGISGVQSCVRSGQEQEVNDRTVVYEGSCSTMHLSDEGRKIRLNLTCGEVQTHTDDSRVVLQYIMQSEALLPCTVYKSGRTVCKQPA